MTTTLPASMRELHPSNIPAELRTIPRWAPWQGVFDPKATRPRWNKIPKSAVNTRYKISTAKPKEWGTFEAALLAVQHNPDEATGLGFCITGLEGFTIIDLDHCLDASGTPAPWASEVVRELKSYAEVSPSGSGLRIAVRGSSSDWTNHEQGVEVYGGTAARFLTFTGRRLPGVPNGINEAPTGVLEGLRGMYGKAATATTNNDSPMPDLIAEDELDSLEQLPIRPDTLAFLRDGATDCHDRSRAVASAANDLAAAGQSPAQILSRLVASRAMDVALGHRHDDHDKATEYLWKHHVLKVTAVHTDVLSMFDIVVLTTEELAESDAARKRNAARDAQLAKNATDKAAFSSRGTLDEKRRAQQKRENEAIGLGECGVPVAEKLTLSEALGRFVFLSDGSRVADILNPQYDLAFPDWASTHAASKVKVPQPKKQMANGSTVQLADKVRPLATAWMESKERKTVICRTFKAGGELTLPDPLGRMALNSWCPYLRDTQIEGDVSPFFEHIAFLFPDSADADRFLDWLAHIEQCPGELPHRAWLHIAKNFGMGRNWLASVLTRVWAGSVAPNLDLPQTLKSGFNGQLSRKLLAIVDEIREGGVNHRGSTPKSSRVLSLRNTDASIQSSVGRAPNLMRAVGCCSAIT